ncbi:xylose isomerase, partial [Methylobacterium indicum]
MSLRFAYNTNGAANHRLDDALSLIADAGYDGVALTLDIHHLDPFAESWAQDAERVRGRLYSLSLGSCLARGSRRKRAPVSITEPRLKE